jgi:hypothetical protein
MNNLWQKHVLNVNAKNDIEELSETVEVALMAISLEGTESIFLGGLSPEKVEPQHLATLLRTTCSWKDDIEGWYDALAVAKEALKLQDIDPEDALYGLI